MQGREYGLCQGGLAKFAAQMPVNPSAEQPHPACGQNINNINQGRTSVKVPSEGVNSASERSGRIVRAGFVAVMLLIGGISLFAALALRDANKALDETVNNDQLAMELEFGMMQASRERAIVLYRLTTSEDPFERDELMLRHDQLGGQFGEARRALVALDQGPAVRLLLEKQRHQTQVTLDWQREVLDRALSDRREDAISLLVSKVIPSQDAALGTINALLEQQINQTRERARQLRQMQRLSAWLLIGIGAVGVLLAAAIARYVRRGTDRLVREISSSAHKLEEANRQLEYQKLAMDQHDIVSIADVDGNILYVNDKFCEISQYSREELVGANHRLLKSTMHPDRFYEGMWRAISAGRIWNGEVCNRKKDGTFYWVTTTIVPFLDDTGVPYQYVSVRTDITDTKEAQQVLMRGRDELEQLVRERTAELAEREDVLRGITNVAHDAVIMLDRRSAVTFWNPAAEKIFGYAEAEILGRNLHALLVSGEQLEAFQAGLAELQQSGAGALMGKTVELTALRNDGVEIFVDISLSAVRIKDGWHVVGIARDVTARKQAEQQLALLATTDPLTGASNRRRFDEVLRTEVARSRRYGAPLSLIICDIDYFKRINDGFGHPAGDRVLQQLSALLSENIRETDVFARLGGEEFAILAPNCDEGCAWKFAEKLRGAVEAHAFPDAQGLTCSFGVAVLRAMEGQEKLVKRADEALYRAKGEGRNRVVLASGPVAG